MNAMTELTDEERAGLESLAQAVTPRDEKTKAEADKFIGMILKSLHDQYEGVDDIMLAKFAGSIALIMSKFERLTICELHIAVESMYQSYGLAACALAGVYDSGAPLPENSEPRHSLHDDTPTPGQYL